VTRLRPTRMHVLLGLVVVLLATIPVLIPMVVTKSGGEQEHGGVRLASGPGVPATPQAAPAPRLDATQAPPARAGSLLPAAGRSATPSPTAAPPAPPAEASTAAASTSATEPPSAEPTGPSPTGPSPTAEAGVLAAGANLVIVEMALSPEQPDAGDQVVFSAVVRNAGSDPTPALPTGVAFAVDGTVVSWSGSDDTPLGSGEERTFTAVDGVAGPAWTATDGRHTVEATVDDTGQIPELNEDDNTATTGIDVP
jgi:CARDB